MRDVELEPIYLWSEARARGARRRQVAADGRRVSRGLYLSCAVPPTLPVRCRAWARLLPPDAAFGLRTAAALMGAPVHPGADVQVVLRPRPVLPQRRGLEVHVRALTAQDVREVDGLRLTSPAQTFLDLAGRLAPAELVAVGDALLRSGQQGRRTSTGGWPGRAASEAWCGPESVRLWCRRWRCRGRRA